MPNKKMQEVIAALEKNKFRVWNEHMSAEREVPAVGLVDGKVVALYERDYFTLSAIEVNAQGVPCLKVGSVVGGVIVLDDQTTLDDAIAKYNDLNNYDSWYRQYHKQITEVTYLI